MKTSISGSILFALAIILSACTGNSKRWTIEEANEWYDQQPFFVGANYVPASAINQLEMWQEDTFDPKRIDFELQRASEIGMNTMRVFLHDLAWKQDKNGFFKRVDNFLEISEKHDMKIMFVLFDGVWNPYPKPGKQPEAVPHVHNSGWVQSPGRVILQDSDKQDELKDYVQDVISRYKNDDRVLIWDIFNEPDNASVGNFGEGSKDPEMPAEEKKTRALELLDKAFAWAREIGPSQPLTVGVWGDPTWLEEPDDIEKFSLENSDIISFHSYMDPEPTEKVVNGLKEYGRPLMCTEYMARPNESSFEGILPIFHKNKVAAYNWGLFNGKTQTIYPWSSWDEKFTAEPELWHHDVFRKDGTPYDVEETRLIKELSAMPTSVIRNRPNIVILMADDLGYSDLGCYGGEIRTPNLDALAENGVRFTQFYNASRCCPTRASLLTGKYPHQVGLDKNGQSLSRNAATIAEVLKENGYHTGMSGKWHLSVTRQLDDAEEQLRWLSHRKDSSVFAPLESYPSNRGFEEHWGVIWGVVNFFDPFSLVHNEEEIKDVPDDFYMTDFITDKSIDLVDEFSKDDKPFFLYVAHTAPHWPLHALPEDIAKYEGVYDEGWDQLQESRYRGLIEQGIVNPEIAPLAKNESGEFWVDCEEKEWETKHMEAHAAMVDRLDQGIGRLIQKLKECGEYENTMILFLADNGASPERGYKPGFDRPGQTREGEEIIYPHQEYERPGDELTWGYLGANWAGAINAPFRYWKKESFEGGNCTPFIVHWPAGMSGKENTINNGIGHVIDILPTCLELAEAEYPTQINGLPTTPIEGSSILPLLNGKITSTHDTLFWEHEGGRALRIGDWKISALSMGEWELFNLAEDRTETKNLAEEMPEKVADMEKVWEKNFERIFP